MFPLENGLHDYHRLMYIYRVSDLVGALDLLVHFSKIDFRSHIQPLGFGKGKVANI
jgi:hypothetical protein